MILIDSNHLWGLNDESQRNCEFPRLPNPNHDCTMAKAPLTIPFLTEKDKERFFSKIRVVESGCHEWQACIEKGGYARTKILDSSDKKRGYFVHRVALFLATGEQPADKHVCHTCDNPKCCNPEHLFFGTRSDNMRDMLAKGRGNKAKGERNCFAKLTAEVVTNVRGDFANKVPVKEIVEKHGIGRSNIYMILNRQTWRHIP